MNKLILKGMSIMGAEKIVNLWNSEVFNDITTFLNEARMHSAKTAESYESNIRQFFRETRQKEIEFLTLDDLKFKRNDILNYRQRLQEMKKENNPDELKYKANTINQKLASIRSLFENLKSNDYEVNPAIFKIKKLAEHVQSYGNLSQTEADRMAETVWKTESTKAYTKYCLILFATRTSFRLDEILRCKWSNITEDIGYYKVSLIGKGQKERTTSISNKLYEKLLVLKDENKKYKWNRDSELIFQISEDAINHMMKRLREELNISKDRNIVFHSFRKVAIDYELETTGDVKAALLHSGHSSMDIMHKAYLDKTRDYSQTPGIRMDEELDLSFIEELTLDNFKDFVANGDHKLKIELKRYFDNLHK